MLAGSRIAWRKEDFLAAKYRASRMAALHRNLLRDSPLAKNVTFGEEWDILVADLEAAKKHSWQVARPDAYPEFFTRRVGCHCGCRWPGTWNWSRDACEPSPTS
jgi:hypothetical protein